MNRYSITPNRLSNFFKYLIFFVTITKVGVEFNVYGEVVAYASNFVTGSHKRIPLTGELKRMAAAIEPSQSTWSRIAEKSQSAIQAAVPDATGTEPTVVALPTLNGMDAEVVMRDLKGPDGIAIDKQGRVYVVEEDAAAVTMIHDGRRTVSLNRQTPLFRKDIEGLVPVQQCLRSPEGIAFSAAGHLFLVEDVPGGRILEYQLNEAGVSTGGHEVYLPGQWQGFAWESIAVGPQNELLVAGSNAEKAAARKGLPGLPMGVILYRDTEKNWWQVHAEPLASFSSVGFSKDGTKAVYTCEIKGSIGWIDLQHKKLRHGLSTVQAHSPESVEVLPSGHLLITEEPGSLLLLDPVTDNYRRIELHMGNLETSCWNPVDKRLLLSADGQGLLIAFTTDWIVQDEFSALSEAPYDAPTTPEHIPNTCPPFLASVLNYGGLDYRTEGKAPISFKQFARRVPMLAADVQTTPIGTRRSDDPFTSVCFVVFNPNAYGFDHQEAVTPFSIFIARKASGEVVLTHLKPLTAVHKDLLTLKENIQPQTMVTVPFPAAVDVSPKGSGKIHFMGMGDGPDMHVVLNSQNPEESYLVVDHPGGDMEQYQLSARKRDTLSEQMVISYTRDLHRQWQWLGGPALVHEGEIENALAANIEF